MAEKYVQAIGRRKTAIAQVRIVAGGTGKLTVNEKDAKHYFKLQSFIDLALAPLKEVGRSENIDVTVRAVGGGLKGQADAVRMGVARALVKMDDALKATVKSKGFLTRDPRKKERKKFGKRGARRSPQWRKR